jgi:hypothetical protein
VIVRAILAALTASAVAAGLLFAPQLTFSLEIPRDSKTFSVKPADALLVCPGPLIRSGGESGSRVGVLDRTGKANLIASVAAIGQLEIAELDGSSRESLGLDAGRIFLAESYSKSTALRILEAPENQEQGSLNLSGFEYQIAELENMRGLSAASCQQPENELLFLGGSTAAGRESILILANPSPIDATVDIQIHTDLGEIQVSGLAGISVLAESTTLISLASFAPDSTQLAVQVRSEGAKVAGWIQQRTIRGTSAQGVDLIEPVAESSETVVIPGFLIRGTKELRKLFETEDYFDVLHTLRVFAPEGANFTAQIVSSDPEVFGAVFLGQVEPGLVEDFPIDELQNGDYSVIIQSDKPIFASLRAGIGKAEGNPRSDFAWLTSSELITSERVALATGEGTFLTLANLGEDDESVRVKNLETGALTLISVPAFGSRTIPISGTHSISSEKGVYAQLTLLIDGKMAAYSIRDPKNVGGDVVVNFR